MAYHPRKKAYATLVGSFSLDDLSSFYSRVLKGTEKSDVIEHVPQVVTETAAKPPKAKKAKKTKKSKAAADEEL